MTKKILSLLLLCLVGFHLKANGQIGSIQGRIMDTDGFPMPGANIVVVNEPGKGSISDANGKFTLVNVLAGSQTIKISYIGFKSVDVQVIVESRKTSTIEVRLTEAAVVGNELIIIGDQLRGQARALNQQKNNANITNVVSADQVGRFPDANIGDALKRIPGITIQNDQGEARDIIIRGIAPQLNSITLNGVRMPSAEGDNRRIQLDLIPADAIQSVEVNKAVLPDMEGDAIGGSVNLVTRTTPSAQRLSATAASGLNLLSDQPIWNGSVTYGNRLLDDKLGFVLNASYQSHDFGSDNIEAVWVKTAAGKTVIDELDIREYKVRRDRRSASLSVDYKLNDQNTIYVTGMYNWRDDWENRFRFRASQIQRAFDRNQTVSTGTDSYNLPARIEYQTKGGIDNDRVKGARLEDQRTRSIKIGGDHLFNELKMDWSLSYAKASEERPNERYISYRQSSRPSKLDLTNTNKPFIALVDPAVNLTIGFNQLSEQYGMTYEEDLSAKVDFKKLFNEATSVKFGAQMKMKTKNRDNNFFFYVPTSLSTFGATLGNVPYKDYSDSNYLAGKKYQVGKFVTPQFLGGLNLKSSLFRSVDGLDEYIASNYEADEQVVASYVMMDHTFSDKFSVVAGARIEATSIDYIGNQFDVDDESFTSTTGDNEYMNVLPGIHFKFSPNDNARVRLAWTNTLARPGYYQLIPYANFIADDDELSRGNPKLKATSSMNFDLMVERYFENVGLISAGAFYKDITNFIYNQTVDNYTDPVFGSGLTFTTAKNGGTADVFGFEMSIHRQFFKVIGLYLNYTYTNSSTTGIEGREEDDLSLPGTANNMFNGSLSFEKNKLNLRASINYASDYVDEVGESAFDDRYYDKQTFVDVNGSFKFTPKARLFVEVNNLTNQPLRYYQGVSSQMMQEEFYNVRMNFGLKFDLFK
jgi:TonB-dependent receptor